MTSTKMDAEYNCMRRRMSRARGNVGQASYEAEDTPVEEEGNFKDLIKFWKKHGIPIPKDLISDMADESVKIAKAKGQGRRRSRELEDLHMCASTGKFNLEKLSLGNVDEKDEEHDEISEAKHPHKTETTKKPLVRRQTDSPVGLKSRVNSFKKSNSKSSLNGMTTTGVQKKLVSRSLSHNK